MNTIHSFEPVIDNRSKILILGTLPGAKSLKMNQYYADPKNQFWKIIYSVFEKNKMDTEYIDKIQFLLANGVALWDMLHVAEREGSLDVNIQNEKPNDIPSLLKQYPNVQRIILAGGKAAKTYNTHFSDMKIRVEKVPSTSPIPGRNIKSIDEKIQLWKQAITVE